MGRISTPLSEKLGLKYPIVVAPMFIISNVDMVVASAEAGVLGTMPSLNCRTAPEFKDALAEIRDRTAKPFGINIPLKLIDPKRLEHDIDLCLEFEVPVIITSLGDPTEICRRAHERGLAVIHDVIGLKHAMKAEAAGVDAIIAVAAGAGGHAGAVSPFALIPYLKRHVRCPIIAAGAIATGRQVAASLALGAELAYMGTRFIASTECGADAEYKEMCVNGSPEDVVYTNQVSGIWGNFLRATIPGDERYGDLATEAGEKKKWKNIWSAGQGVATPGEIKPIGAIVRELIREYAETVQALPPYVP